MPSDAPWAGDTLALQAALAAEHEAVAVRSVWPGFWNPPPAFLIYDPASGGVLVSSQTPPPPFRPAAGEALPGRAFHRADAPLPGLAGAVHLRHMVGADTLIAVPVDSSGLLPTLERLFHEAFHAFQTRSFAAPGAELPGELPPLASEYTARTEVERRILLRALGAPIDTLPSLLAEYAVVRESRGPLAPPDAAESERRIERIEGSAQLVGILAAHAALGLSPEAEREALGRELRHPLPGTPEARLRRRVYGTGAALGHLLTRLGMSWAPRVQAGATFDLLLREALSQAPAPPPVRSTLETYGIAEIRRALEDAPTEAAPLSEPFEAGLVVRLSSAAMGGRLPDFQVNLGPQGAAAPEQGVAVFADAELFSFSTPRLEVEAKHRTVMLDTRSPVVVEVRIALPVPPVLTVSPTDSPCPTRILAIGEGLRLEGGPACVTISGDWIILDLH